MHVWKAETGSRTERPERGRQPAEWGQAGGGHVGRPSPFDHQLLDSGAAPDPVTLFRVTLGAVDRQCMSISSIQVRSQDPETSSINRGVPNAG